MSNAIKERSAGNSESEVNGNQSVSLGRQGGWITSISAPMFPAFKPLPKVSFQLLSAVSCATRSASLFLPLLHTCRSPVRQIWITMCLSSKRFTTSFGHR